MTANYYNTNNVSGQMLMAFDSKNSTQEALVLTIFQMAFRSLCWVEVQGLLVSEMNEVSIKRSITNLKTKGLIEKTNDKVMGKYGKPCYRYKLKTK